jgi:hypothetical protein
MSRSLTSVSLSLVALFTSVSVGTANAKECKTDSDCASGFTCALYDVKGGSGTGGSTGTTVGGDPGAGAATGTACEGPDCPVSTPGSKPGPLPVDGGSAVPTTSATPPRIVDGGVAALPTPVADAGTATPVATTGTCQPKILVCTSKADCPANLDCVKETAMVKRPACAADTTCDTSLPVSETGTCKSVCNVDSDCPSPLVCKLQGQTCMGGGSVSSDGTVTTIPESCTGGNKICSYEPVTCSTNTECKDANYQCAKVSEYQSCTGSAPAGCPRSKGDAEVVCTPTPAEPPVCTSTVVNNCIPKEIKCDAGQACPTGWSCFDFTYFDGASIPGWSTPMPSKACLPDGLILTINGQANGGSGATYDSKPTRDGSGSIGVDKGGTASGPVTTTGNSTPPQVAPVPTSDGQERAAASDAGAEASTKVRGSGCSLGGTQDGSLNLWLTLGLAGLILRLVQRRK